MSLTSYTIFYLALILTILSAAHCKDQNPLQPDEMTDKLNGKFSVISPSPKASAKVLVFKKPLQMFSKSPLTGFYRDGYCRTSTMDFGNHAVAGIVSEEFLDFTASQGNDLRPAGLSGGCKWCLCTGRWFEAYAAYKDGRIGKNAVPKVDLDATEDSALRKVDLDLFKEFAVKKEGQSEL